MRRCGASVKWHRSKVTDRAAAKLCEEHRTDCGFVQAATELDEVAEKTCRNQTNEHNRQAQSCRAFNTIKDEEVSSPTAVLNIGRDIQDAAEAHSGSCIDLS